MNPLLLQFLTEGREFLQGIGEKLLQLEDNPADSACMDDLFRLVHTLKGNSGLFEVPEMTRVLHAAEDLMDATRAGRVAFSRALADQLLEAMDFVAVLLDDLSAATGEQLPSTSHHAAEAVRLGELLRGLMAQAGEVVSEQLPVASAAPSAPTAVADNVTDNWQLTPDTFIHVPEAQRMDCYRRLSAGATLCWLVYQPDEDCFFKGEDPFFQVIQLPDILWQRVTSREQWAALAELDAYRCLLRFELIVSASPAALAEHFRYVPDQIEIVPLTAAALLMPSGRVHTEPLAAEFTRTAQALLAAGNLTALTQAARTLLELSAPDLWLASALRWLLLVVEHTPQEIDLQRQVLAQIGELGAQNPPKPPFSKGGFAAVNAEVLEAAQTVLAAQRDILSLTDSAPWLTGRLQAAAASLAGTCASLGCDAELTALNHALTAAISAKTPAPLLAWLDNSPLPVEKGTSSSPSFGKEGQGGILSTAGGLLSQPPDLKSPQPPFSKGGLDAVSNPPSPSFPKGGLDAPLSKAGLSEEPAFNRRAEDHQVSPRTLKVDQVKIDRLMNLIGEMVVAKNALPYLAGRAEEVFGVRELSREIKSQYSVINRIAEEMQDAIMQVRLLPVSFIFQRFPRLVRDLAHKLGKEVRLVMEGDTTEADKNIIEALSDPLIHIVRNSLDHGLETPAVRQAAGKPSEGRLTIQARQESDRVVITISDDGRGIDPVVIRHKAYEKGIVDEVELERLTDQEAINLVFAAGFSTAETITDLSGRGVGMDVVRDAIAKVNGTIELRSTVGKGTQLRLSLPLSMAVTNVMMIESAGQRFGVPMDAVAETVRVPRRAVRTIKRRLTTVLRDRLVPLVALNELLALEVPQRTNGDDEFAVLVVRIDGDYLGIIVDECRETVDIILKPLAGFLGSLNGYAGSALLGDGSVLLVLNPRELL
ncbi:chemotaxis protein CheA [Chromatium okenii]|uniref:chemotaxis protein CheA n=1 Tax=Chromatium okenii TaxID=61644 RepID=UPI001905EC20|nr:chemotaxis protein CheA [Chromatium okenii]MBK1642349.1 chemotaxis protein CheA [Chromatium okenii]